MERRGLEDRASRSSTLRLVLAPGAGSATIGGVATRCVCRLYRSRETERDHCYQQNCPNGLHGFSPLENERVFVSRWHGHRREDGATLLIVLSRCEGDAIREECLCPYARLLEQIRPRWRTG